MSRIPVGSGTVGEFGLPTWNVSFMIASLFNGVGGARLRHMSDRTSTIRREQFCMYS